MFLGVCNTPFGKGFLRPFQWYITNPKTPNISVGKLKKQICSRLAPANWGGQKNHNGKTNAVFFRIIFY